MWYAMFSYNLEYAEHSHYISGATHVYRDVLYFTQVSDLEFKPFEHTL